MRTRKVIFDVFTSHEGEVDWTSKCTFKASEVLSVSYKFLTPYYGGQKLAIIRPNKDIVNIAIRDQHGESGKLVWSGLTFNGRADIFVKTPAGTSCRVIGALEIENETDTNYIIDPARISQGAQAN
ncbi:hypothetical protein OAK65_02615 [Synechococcus sp. AH-551-N17]|nr:hypothetical protein [Synechococcus sp. AH-551-N17]